MPLVIVTVLLFSDSEGWASVLFELASVRSTEMVELPLTVMALPKARGVAVPAAAKF